MLERHPWPDAGEVIHQPIPPRVLGPAWQTPLPPPPAGQPLPWGRAGRHVGQTITIRGRVMQATPFGRVCFLKFAHDWRSLFYVLLMPGDAPGWAPHPEQEYLGRIILVTGKVRRHNGYPQIVVTKSSQIRSIPDTGLPTAHGVGD